MGLGDLRRANRTWLTKAIKSLWIGLAKYCFWFINMPGKLRTRLEYLIGRCLFSSLALLPRPLAFGACRAIAHLAFLVGWRLRRTGEINLALAFPQMSAHDRSRLLRGSILNLGRHLGEFSRFSTATPESLRKTIDCKGLENLDAARARGGGVIMITAHLGAWEMISFALSAFGYSFEFLVRRIDNPAVEQMIDKTRTRFGNRTIDKRNAARSMLATLRAGAMLGLLVDVNVVRNKGIFVDFFGVPASTTFIAAKLALRTGAAVLPVFAPWDEQRQRYVLDIGAPLTIERSGDEKKDIRELTANFNKIVEDYVRRYPDQWLWIHKRWRTRPLGEKNFYAT